MRRFQGWLRGDLLRGSRIKREFQESVESRGPCLTLVRVVAAGPVEHGVPDPDMARESLDHALKSGAP